MMMKCCRCKNLITVQQSYNACVTSLEHIAPCVLPRKGAHGYCDKCALSVRRCMGCSSVPQLNCCLLTAFECGRYECPACYRTHSKHCNMPGCKPSPVQAQAVSNGADTVHIVTSPNVNDGDEKPPLSPSDVRTLRDFIEDRKLWKALMRVKVDAFNSPVGMRVRMTSAPNFVHTVSELSEKHENRKRTSSKKNPLRKQCMLCGRKTKFCCEICGMALCIRLQAGSAMGATCFQKFHQVGTVVGHYSNSGGGGTPKERKKRGTTRKRTREPLPGPAVVVNADSESTVDNSSPEPKTTKKQRVRREPPVTSAAAAAAAAAVGVSAVPTSSS